MPKRLAFVRIPDFFRLRGSSSPTLLVLLIFWSLPSAPSWSQNSASSASLRPGAVWQPLVTVVDLDIGRPVTAQLANGEEVLLVARNVTVSRDAVMGAIRQVVRGRGSQWTQVAARFRTLPSATDRWRRTSRLPRCCRLRNRLAH